MLRSAQDCSGGILADLHPPPARRHVSRDGRESVRQRHLRSVSRHEPAWAPVGRLANAPQTGGAERRSGLARGTACRTGLPHREVTMIRTRLRAMVLAVSLTVVVGRLCAQDVAVGGRLGLVGGAVWFEDEESNDLMQPMPGLQIGGVAAYRSRSIVSLQAELWYVQKGWTETRAGGGRRLAYVELPLLLTVTAPWRTAPQLVAGASGSFELGCSVTGVPEVGSVSCDDPRVEWHRRKAQVATWLGFGVRRRFGRSHLDVQLLGNLNLTSVNREPLPRGFTRLFAFAVSAAYVVPLGGR